MKKFNSNQLKLFMAFLMVLDHLYYVPGLLSSEAIAVCHVITRCVAVWFAYMVVEGFKYTGNRIKYNIRLFIWAALMEAGNFLLSNMLSLKDIAVHNNIFMTFAFSVLLLNLICNYKDNSLQMKLLKAIGVVCSFIAMIVILPEGFIVIVPFVLITYFTDGKHRIRYMLYVLFSIFLFATSFSLYETIETTVLMLAYNSEFMFIAIIPFMLVYNGERGKRSQFTKYFFYIFYPSHIWLLATIGYFVK